MALFANGIEVAMKADVSAVERDAARVLAELSEISADDVAAVVQEGRAFGSPQTEGVRWARIRYELDGSPRREQ